MTSWMTDRRASVVDPSAAAALGGSVAAEPRGFQRVDESIPLSSRGIPLDSERRRAQRARAEPVEAPLARLHATQASHPFWQNRLFRASAAGALTRADFAVVFSQYYLYSQSFTRYLAALMANCENDLLRSKLAENIWEEGGGQAPAERHAELFRGFLRGGLGVNPDDVDFLDATRFFVHEYLDFCVRAPPAAGSAFLSLGTEGIVPRMYAILLDGLLKAGVPEEHTRFFRIHMECDDAHAETLEQIMTSYAARPDWLPVCEGAMTYALDLRRRFFEQLYEAVQAARLAPIMDRIQRAASLAPDEPEVSALLHRPGAAGEPLYTNADPRRGIDFSVERVPFAAEVFDTRILRVAARKHNEAHKHPHESVFHVISGRGKVHVNRVGFDVGPGDIVFVPRWATHFSQSTGDEELVILALTDFGLTDKAYIGDHLAHTRQKGTQAARTTSSVPPKAGPR